MGYGRFYLQIRRVDMDHYEVVVAYQMIENDDYHWNLIPYTWVILWIWYLTCETCLSHRTLVRNAIPRPFQNIMKPEKVKSFLNGFV